MLKLPLKNKLLIKMSHAIFSFGYLRIFRSLKTETYFNMGNRYILCEPPVKYTKMTGIIHTYIIKSQIQENNFQLRFRVDLRPIGAPRRVPVGPMGKKFEVFWDIPIDTWFMPKVLIFIITLPHARAVKSDIGSGHLHTTTYLFWSREAWPRTSMWQIWHFNNSTSK